MTELQPKTVVKPESVSGLEKVIGLSSDALQTMFVQLRGEVQEGIETLLSEQLFHRGAEGVPEKQSFAESGGIIVQSGVALTVHVPNHPRKQEQLAQAVIGRNTKNHAVMTDFSILTSGGGDLSALEVLERKLHLPKRLELDDPELMGIGVSVRKGIKYLFLLHHLVAHTKQADVPKTLKLSSGKDTLSFLPPELTRTPLKNNVMEQALLSVIGQKLDHTFQSGDEN